MATIITKIKNNVLISFYEEIGILVTKDNKLIIPIFSFIALLKYLIFSEIIDYRAVQEVINEYKEFRLGGKG